MYQNGCLATRRRPHQLLTNRQIAGSGTPRRHWRFCACAVASWAGEAAFLPAFRATQEVAPRRLRGASAVIGGVSSTGVRVFRPFGFLCPAPRLLLLGSPAVSPAPESSPLPVTGSPPRRDSQVGPAPPSSLPAAMALPTPPAPPRGSGPRGEAPGREPAG